jgi:hypothetical protein
MYRRRDQSTMARREFISRLRWLGAPPISVTAAEAPKHEAHALKALKQRKPAHAAKLGMVAEHPRQAVERNAAA